MNPKLIVGLGNPGPEYYKTRHNLGFLLIDVLAERFDAPWLQKSKFKALIAETRVGSQKVLFAKPTTFYNLSGESVKAMADFYKVPSSDILVIHDELDITFGTIRARLDGSAAGNNGIKNIIAHMGENFARLRVGIKPEQLAPEDKKDFVLNRFTKTEEGQIPDLAKHVQKFVEDFINDDSEFSHTSLSI